MINKKKRCITFFSFLLLTIFICNISAQTAGQEKLLKVNLEKCIELTLQNNNSYNYYNYAEKTAEAQLRQAQSGKYPSLDFSASYTRIDEDPYYVVPEFKMEIPAISLGSLSTPALTMPVPQQNVKLADKQNFQTSFDLTWAIYTGGKISSYVEQAETGIAIAKSDSRINKDQIIYETKKLYYSILLASKLEEIANDTRDKLETTLSVTESLYKNGSGRVTKTDYLKNKMMVEVVKTLCEQISGEKKSAVAALINTMGLEWQTQIELLDSEIPFVVNNEPLEGLINKLYDSNPMFSKMDNALNIYQLKIDEAKSDYYPSVGLIGGFYKSFNKYGYGIVCPQNRNIWMIGLGMKLSIFNGFLTSAKVEENKSEFDKLSQQKETLKKGLTLKLQYVYQKMSTAAAKEISSKEAMNSAIENRELIEKAYFNDIMELEDLLQAQLTEAFLEAQYQTVLFEHADYSAQLENLLSQNK